MASSDLHYFILTQPVRGLFTCKPGQICSASSFKLRKQGTKLDVVFNNSLTGVDYPVDKDSLQSISHEEAALLMPLPEENRLKALKQPQSLRSARRLREGTEVWVQEESALLKGTIRYIGPITEPRSKRDIPGTLYGVELLGSDRGRGSTDGTLRFKKFFSCDKNCGVFASFNKITAVGPQTSPDPQPRESPQPRKDPELKLGLKLLTKSRPEPRQQRDLEQPLSFLSGHFQDPPQREAAPRSSTEIPWDSGPKSLSADPDPMDQDHEYKDPDQLHDPLKGVSKFRSKSLKSKTDGKDKPKIRLERPGSARRAIPAFPESRPESRAESVPNNRANGRPESEEADHGKSYAEVAKTRLANLRSPRLGSRPQAESEPRATPRTEGRSGPESPEGAKPGLSWGSPEELLTGDHVMFIDDEEKTVKGTFLFMEETEAGTVAHIKGDNKMLHIVPLVALAKMEPEAEDMYADPKGPPSPRFKESILESRPEPRPEQRPESEIPDPVKSLSETEKTRFQVEAELKARTRAMIGPESRPKARPESPERPKLTAGDQVMFLNEKEQVMKGTVVFMENTDEGVVVYIAGESGTSTVPLQNVKKMEQKTDSENLYEDPDSKTPPAERQDICSSLGLESVVEIDLGKGEKGHGTVRWIGFLPGFQHKMAGLELEKPRGVSDGMFRGHRFFSCPEKHALFVKLSSCRPDSRFCRSSANHSPPDMEGSANQSAANPREFTNHSGPRAHPHHNGFTITHQDDSADLEPVPPVAAEDVERLLIGRMRGIQGHHNSCYMDSALFSLFSVSSVLDSLLYKSTSPQDAEVQKILLRDIVNPLRRDGFVHGCHIMNLRKQLQKHGFSHSFTTDEKDPEEFLTVIMQHILNLDPLLKLWSGGKVQDSFCFQIFLDQSHDLVLPSVQQLLEHSFQSNALRLSEVPSCLILQMPRFGKKFKMFDKILPSLELDLTDLLQHGPKQCCLCGDSAQCDCSECFLDPTFGSTGLKLFCDQCSRQVHAHPRRHGHRPTPLDTGHHCDSERFHGNRDKLHLLAVLCIETSHYVSFVKYGPDATHWLFFDSMADREGEADGFNVPQVSLAPELGQYLTMSLSELANQAPRDMKGVAKRLLCDAYLYIYQSPALHLYT